MFFHPSLQPPFPLTAKTFLPLYKDGWGSQRLSVALKTIMYLVHRNVENNKRLSNVYCVVGTMLGADVLFFGSHKSPDVGVRTN